MVQTRGNAMNLTELKSGMRKRHNLAETADVRLLQSVMSLKDIDDSDPYKFTARITTDSVDRQNEVVIPAGGDMTEFMRSGVIFMNHAYDSPIGFPNKDAKITRGDDYIECGGIF